MSATPFDHTDRDGDAPTVYSGRVPGRPPCRLPRKRSRTLHRTRVVGWRDPRRSNAPACRTCGPWMVPS